jgi:hypothetical protein
VDTVTQASTSFVYPTIVHINKPHTFNIGYEQLTEAALEVGNSLEPFSEDLHCLDPSEPEIQWVDADGDESELYSDYLFAKTG